MAKECPWPSIEDHVFADHDSTISRQLSQLDASRPEYASRFVELLLAAAGAVRASDVHLQPTQQGLALSWRLDGVLQSIGTFPRGEATDVVSRLKVLADLLTYRTDVPQEGRLREQRAGVEVRVSTFPTLYGERAVVRLFAEAGRFHHLADLGLPPDVADRLLHLLAETSGAILITGPAGSGKTTTAYACLRELVRQAAGGKSIVSLEDPIETAVPGVAQSRVNPAAGFDLATGLRSLMRQDPEAIMVGEIRDRATAEAAFQAALTGHLVVTTFHAGSSAGAISRLSDMGIEPYLLRSGILGILSQRLVRKLCSCRQPVADEAAKLNLPVEQAWEAVGCPACLNSGYSGRVVLAELLLAEPSDLGRAILSRSDSPQLERLAIEAGMTPLFQRALAALRAAQTSPSEIRRVLGFS